MAGRADGPPPPASEDGVFTLARLSGAVCFRAERGRRGFRWSGYSRARADERGLCDVGLFGRRAGRPDGPRKAFLLGLGCLIAADQILAASEGLAGIAIGIGIALWGLHMVTQGAALDPRRGYGTG